MPRLVHGCLAGSCSSNLGSNPNLPKQTTAFLKRRDYAGLYLRNHDHLHEKNGLEKNGLMVKKVLVLKRLTYFYLKELQCEGETDEIGRERERKR